MGKKVTVMGLGRSGVGAANTLRRLGADVTVTDSREQAELGDYPARLDAGVKTAFGSHPGVLFRAADLVVMSPGIPLSAPPLVTAAEAGVEVMGELELAYRLSDSPFIAITGTNGKSTTTTLVGEMLKNAGKAAYVGGNLGNALTDKPEMLMGQDYVVAEVSSFQLEATEAFKPKIAAILNIAPDHLDRYSSMEEYVEAKALIFQNQDMDDRLVLNADDPEVMELRPRALSDVLLFSRKRHVREGVYVHDDVIVNAVEPGRRKHIIDVSDVRIKGVHNLENALAATAIAAAAGVPDSLITKTLQEFAGLEHRMEPVRELGGVSYVNDSKGTNVGAVMMSLMSLDGPVILIAGGLDKHGDFGPLRPLVRERVKKLILIGQAADVMERALGSETATERAGSLEEAVRAARDAASAGDTVLLSPACASFDMFKDFEHRGRVFKEIVGGL